MNNKIEISTVVTVQDEVEGCSFALTGVGKFDNGGGSEEIAVKFNHILTKNIQ